MSSDMRQFANVIPQAMKSPAWLDDSVFKLYLYCLSRASHNRCIWHGIQLEPGDMPMSERQASEDLFWSRNKLDRKLKMLHETGLVNVERVPQKGLMLHVFNWFQNGASYAETGSTVEPEDFQNGASSDLRISKMEPVFVQNGASLPATGSKLEPNPIEKNRYSSLTHNPIPEPEGFTEIWVAYPVNRRTNRPEAATLVAKAQAEGATTEAILEALESDKRSVAWCQEDGRYIPGIVKWLQKEAWRDYLKPEEPEEDDEQWITL